MAYDPSKDILLFSTPKSNDDLIIEVRSYSNTPAKISFVKEYSYNNQTKLKPAYRLSLQDFEYFGNFWSQICSIIQQHDANLK